MPDKERPYFPPLPPLYPRTEFIPPVPGDELAPLAAPELLSPSGEHQLPAPTGEAAPTAEANEQERVTLAGRLGQDPRTRTTPKGRLIAQFPLGVKDQPDIEKTRWLQVIAFDRRAEQVRDTLRRGDVVEVIGYVHTREVPGRTGPRLIEEIYATVIKPR